MNHSHLKYEEITEWSRAAVDQALRDNDVEALLVAVIAVSMYDPEWRYAQDLCIRLSSHAHYNVRGNAVLGFGHISRVHRQLDREIVQPIIRAALRDDNAYIRGQAYCAMDDTENFLKWHYDESDTN
jgi:hypothetical protein